MSRTTYLILPGLKIVKLQLFLTASSLKQSRNKYFIPGCKCECTHASMYMVDAHSMSQQATASFFGVTTSNGAQQHVQHAKRKEKARKAESRRRLTSSASPGPAAGPESAAGPYGHSPQLCQTTRALTNYPSRCTASSCAGSVKARGTPRNIPVTGCFPAIMRSRRHATTLSVQRRRHEVCSLTVRT